MEHNECQICVEKYNKSNRIKLKCMYCEFESCRKCNETYLLSETIPKCMNVDCGREWTRKYMMEHFTKSFVNGTYKKHREQILIDKERALMPATQIYVERHIHLQRILNEHAILSNQLDEIIQRRNQLAYDISRARRLLETNLSQDEQREVAQFVHACPDNDCRGFLSTQWKCGVCNKWTCNLCHEIKGLERNAEHTCDPANVATATMLARDTKPCPNCHTPIHKIDGCDQMWCVMCHTAFSWRTGRIETTIHNPHYFEWLRRQANGRDIPRNPGDNPCNNRVDVYVFSRFFTQTDRQFTFLIEHEPFNTSVVKLKDIVDLFRENQHNRHVELERYRNGINNYEQRNRDLRISYMLNKIDDDTYKTTLQQREKKRNKSQELTNILTILVDTVDDIMMRVYTQFRQAYNVYSFPQNDGNVRGNREELIQQMIVSLTPLMELDTIVNYVNECLAELSRTYNSVCYSVNNKLRIVTA